MLPCLSIHDGQDVDVSHQKLCADASARHTRCIKTSDLYNFFGRKLRSVVLLAACFLPPVAPTLIPHILDIFGVRGDEQVAWPYTKRGIAFMTHKQPARNRAVVENPGQPVRPFTPTMFSTKIDRSIPARSSPSPQPAISTFINLLPETLLNWNSPSLSHDSSVPYLGSPLNLPA